MISELNKRKNKIALINARMSEKSFKRWFLIKYIGKNILEKFHYIFPQNKETFLYFKRLGIKKIKFLGNLKFINTHNDKFKKLDKKFLKIN